ncbi:MAG TPA: hypothetical protein VIH59_22900 [Candidatus Tectomicrobia bacterium]|jgi:hypothetical protein
MSAAGVAGDSTAVERKVPSRRRIVTTLYDLIAALQDSSAPGEEALVTAAVVHLLHSGRVKFLDRPEGCEASVPQELHGSLLLV